MIEKCVYGFKDNSVERGRWKGHQTNLPRILAPLDHFSHVFDKHICFFSPSADCSSSLCAEQYLHGFEATNTRTHFTWMMLTRNSREMLPKNDARLFEDECMNKYFLLLSDPQLSQKNFIVLFALEVCWMNLLYNNERASQHRNFTFIKKAWRRNKKVCCFCFFYAIICCDIFLFINLWDFTIFLLLPKLFADDGLCVEKDFFSLYSEQRCAYLTFNWNS